MKSVTISRSTAQTCRPGGYRLDINVTSTNGISQYLFIKQRIIKPDGTIDDTFVAVASPAEIENIPELAPAETSYFRDNNISLIADDPDLLYAIENDIAEDIQLTVDQANELDVMSEAEVTTITST